MSNGRRRIFEVQNCANGEQLAPKIRRMYWYWPIMLSSNHRKRKADWSSLQIAICRNMLSISARTPMACSRKRRISSSKSAKRSGPVRIQVLRHQPLNFEAAFATRRIFPGLFGFSTGCVGKYQILSGGGCCLITGLTYFEGRSLMRVSLYSCKTIGLSLRRFSRLRA